jgi:D-ribose pyranose/furanose isomerase RbsD
MATYLQGVTDYIPQFQPFQPDLNFYANALQTKQNQYDTNYKALNNVYGQYFYADLTHGDNLKKKDELIKSIDFNLKRVSGLDLSLEQNVTQAQQVFKPFYEDKNLMKDMAWTKNINSQKSYAAGLKNNRDEKQRAQYWEAGLKALEYKTEEFKNASLEETMSIGNANYTPYVNVMEKAQKIAKDAGLSVETVDFSPDGKWVVKTKNGEQLIPKLSHLFEATLGSDPGVIDVYKTQAYVNRKDYAYSNAAQFAGDKNAAEMSYLSESYKMLKAENEARQARLEKNDKVYSTKAAEAEKAVASNEATPETASYLERLNEAKNINSSLLSSTSSNVESLSEKSGTPSTSTGFENPYGDIESLRWKVDNAMASRLMQKDLGEAANVFAFKDAKQDINANPYAVQAEAHKYRMQEVASANASRERAAKTASLANMDKHLVESGAYHYDQNPASATYGRAIISEDADQYTVEQKTKGASTDVINLKDASATYSNRFIDKGVTPYLTNMLSSLESLKGKLSADDMQTIFGDKNMTIEKFNQQLKNDPHKFIKGELGTTKLKKITTGFQKVISQNYNKGVKEFDEVGKNMSQFNTGLNDYYTYTTNLQKWKKGTIQDVKNHLERTLDKDMKNYVKFMFDENGNQVSEAEFIKRSGITPPHSNPKVEAEKQRWANISNEMFTVSPVTGTKIKDSKVKPNKPETPYNELKKAIHDAYQSTDIKLTPPPGISAMADMKGAGLTTIGQQGITVYPNAYNSVGAANWTEFKKDIKSLDFDNDVDVRFLGPVASGVNRNKEGKQLLDAMFNETAKYNSTFKGFRLAAQPLAQNKTNKGAMIIYPDAEWLKKQTYTKTEKGVKSAGIISQQQADYILQNGISLVSDNKNWTNNLFQSTYTTPLEADVNFNKKVTIKDPNDGDNMNNITFEKDDIMGGYKYNFGYKFYNPDTKRYEQASVPGAGIASGQELEQRRNDAFNYWSQVQDINNENFRSVK